MVSKTKKVSSSTSNKKATKKASSKKDNMFIKLMPKYRKKMDKEGKEWEEKGGKGFVSYKMTEFFIKELYPTGYMKLKRCSQKHCNEQFDKLIEMFSNNMEKDDDESLKLILKIYRQVLKDSGQKRSKSIFLIEDEKLKKKLLKEVEKKIKLYKEEQSEKYKPYIKELKKCVKNNCNQEKEKYIKSVKSKIGKDKKTSDMLKFI